jgi:hypothetical protein
MNSLFPPAYPGEESALHGKQPVRQAAQVEQVPRKLELPLWVKAGALIYVAAVVLIASTLFPSLRSDRLFTADVFLTPLIFLIVISSIALNIGFELMRQRALLRTGTCCVGTIISQRKIGNGRHKQSEIIYQFPVGGHKPMTGRGIDGSKFYKLNMPVLVFYDPKDISRNVAICSTNWRVRTEAGYILEP